MSLDVKDKELVISGQILANGMDYLPGYNVLRDGEQLIASKIGLISLSNRLIRIVPLVGKYVPKRGDRIIGKVTSVGMSGWRVDFGWGFEANISLKDGTTDFVERGADLTKYYRPGDYLMAEVLNVAGTKIVDLGMKGPGLRRLGSGRVVHIKSAKVPRVIGKAGSMISMIKEITGSRIYVGQNGMIWLNAEDPKMESIAVDAIMKVEAEAHTSGLTDKMKEYLEKETGKKVSGAKNDLQENGKKE